MPVYEYVVELLVQKLNDPIVQKASFFHRVGDEVRYIQDELEMIRRSLPDAYEKQGRDERVKLWMQDVTDAVYDLEDIIDRMVSKTAPHRQGGFMGSLNRCALTFNKLIVRRKVALEIERIMIKIRSISDASSAYGIQCTNWAEGTSTAGQNLRAHLIVEPDIAGSDRESYTLAGYLTEDWLELCVVILLGELGHGKTTLARRLYNEYREKKFLNSRTWVFVSHDYDLKTLLLEIINCGMVQSDVELKAMMEKDIVELTEHIFNYLEDKRYLMVFDEIWENKAWDDLKNAFPDKKDGSRVLFVTRNSDLSSHLLTVSWTHELSSLSNADKWELFSKKASTQKQDIPKSFKLFLQNSPPLAIVVIGGLLSRKERNEWENILESIQSLNEVISLGYKDLPYYLKPCFLYLGIFPENYEFHPKKLIQCWVAEGFLQQRGNHKTPEELGEEFLLELIQRGMIQVAERSASGCIKRCCISFLVRNLSNSEAEEENFLDVFHEHSRPRQTATQH
ncbi:putative disease resistance protein At1g50180 [Magnolia sinica]|uniref:putative disease resistance protein At1g50180 n=1 Tax=Magnolia sinica TaxID=86752 RepID=UPI00265936E9|nr:putative disease resistance protein At1g50180 [Magnolia sinica]